MRKPRRIPGGVWVVVFNVHLQSTWGVTSWISGPVVAWLGCAGYAGAYHLEVPWPGIVPQWRGGADWADDQSGGFREAAKAPRTSLLVAAGALGTLHFSIKLVLLPLARSILCEEYYPLQMVRYSCNLYRECSSSGALRTVPSWVAGRCGWCASLLCPNGWWGESGWFSSVRRLFVDSHPGGSVGLQAGQAAPSFHLRVTSAFGEKHCI